MRSGLFVAEDTRLDLTYYAILSAALFAASFIARNLFGEPKQTSFLIKTIRISLIDCSLLLPFGCFVLSLVKATSPPIFNPLSIIFFPLFYMMLVWPSVVSAGLILLYRAKKPAIQDWKSRVLDGSFCVIMLASLVASYLEDMKIE